MRVTATFKSFLIIKKTQKEIVQNGRFPVRALNLKTEVQDDLAIQVRVCMVGLLYSTRDSSRNEAVTTKNSTKLHGEPCFPFFFLLLPLTTVVVVVPPYSHTDILVQLRIFGMMEEDANQINFAQNGL